MQFTNLNIMNFSLFLGISILLFGIFYLFLKNQKNLNKKYPGIAKNKYFYVKYIFLILSFLVLFLSIFGIKISSGEKNKISGVDIIFALDVSKSMNVADINDEKYFYTRLDFAKKAITDFVSKNSGNRYSLVIFSGEAISTLPLTTDSNIFLTLLQNVDYRNLTKQGSNFKEALNFANKRFYNSQDRAKAVVLISDGADKNSNLDFDGIYKKNISYFVAGIGTEKGGKIIIGRNHFGEINYQKYNGEYVVVALNEENLRKLSSVLKADYKKLSNFSDLDYFEKSLNKLEKKSIEISQNSNLTDFSRFLTFISFIFFMIFFVWKLREK